MPQLDSSLPLLGALVEPLSRDEFLDSRRGILDELLALGARLRPFILDLIEALIFLGNAEFRERTAHGERGEVVDRRDSEVLLLFSVQGHLGWRLVLLFLLNLWL